MSGVLRARIDSSAAVRALTAVADAALVDNVRVDLPNGELSKWEQF